MGEMSMDEQTKFQKAHAAFLEDKVEGRRLQGEVARLKVVTDGADDRFDEMIAHAVRIRDATCAAAVTDFEACERDAEADRKLVRKNYASAIESYDKIVKRIELRAESLRELLNDEIRNQ